MSESLHRLFLFSLKIFLHVFIYYVIIQTNKLNGKEKAAF